MKHLVEFGALSTKYAVSYCSSSMTILGYHNSIIYKSYKVVFKAMQIVSSYLKCEGALSKFLSTKDVCKGDYIGAMIILQHRPI